MNHEGTKDTKGVALGETLIRIAIRSTLILCVVASVSLATIIIRFYWLNSVFNATLEEQWALLELIDPDVTAHNVWGNAVLGTYLPIERTSKPLSDMRKLTSSLREIVSNSELDIEEKRRRAYELLLGDSRSRDFVKRHASHFGVATEE